MIGFIGNLEPIKNVLVLPEVFYDIQNKIQQEISFVIIGDGRLQNQLKEKMRSLGVLNVIFLGKLLPDKIPNYLNTFNVLLLPSLNEGMPRVALEAQACGVPVVGSDVGGIPEVIGDENCFALNQDFEKNIADKTVDILLKYEEHPMLKDEFSWDEAVKKEIGIFNTILSK